MRRLFIVRHGNTFAPGDPPLRIGARTDLPLVASGIAQGEALGRWFAAEGIHFDAAFVSPLLRTRQTASLILAALPDAPVPQPAPWLAEIDHGPDEGRTDAAIVARIGAAALAAWDTQAIVPPGWTIDVPARLAAWRQLYAEQAAHPAGNVLIVTSNGAARFALLAAPPLLEQARALPSLKIRTGAWGEIALARDGIPTLIAWDRRPA